MSTRARRSTKSCESQLDAGIERAVRERRMFERRVAAFQELECLCAASSGVLPGGVVEAIWPMIAKWYYDHTQALICELAQRCAHSGATLAEARSALHKQLNLGRVRWRQRLTLPTPTLPPDLDDIDKIAFVLLRTEANSAKRLPLSRTHLDRILGPHFCKSLNYRSNNVQNDRLNGRRTGS